MSRNHEEKADVRSLSRLFVYARDESIRMGLLLEAQFADMAVLSLNAQQKQNGTARETSQAANGPAEDRRSTS
jgi:hypothetical protein